MFIDLQTSKADIKNLLLEIGFITDNNEEIIEVTKPGEGNMNVVLRIKTNMRSFIVKQSRPFVQKYQDIDAPIERIDVEYQFYSAIAHNDFLNKHVPKILLYNASHHLLILEDLGNCTDMTSLYDAKEIKLDNIELLINIATNIHQAKAPSNYPENRSLRILNHQHIFELPFLEDNGFSLNDVQLGLEKLSIPYKRDVRLKNRIKEIGNTYLSEGSTLLHGDFYPGSWMSKKDHIYIIDPEFSFVGFPEFDLGVLAAHAMMIAKSKSVLSSIEKNYPTAINSQLLAQVTGIEIMRRLIGLAQLPISFSLKEKEDLLQSAYSIIMN